MNSKIHIEIDGRVLETEPGTMVIQVADKAGIQIPRFCYHDELSVAANCRMCLVEVEKSPKELPACATPVTDGMKVFTRSNRALAAQKAVMEFLLINHPLDCPICDQGGQCELQDVSMGYGGDVSHYKESKRVVDDENLGSLIATDMTRCIHCTRCVRFGDEIAGLRELGATARGENMRIGTYVKHSLQSEISGNIIDLCPVGALTSKPFRYTARAWELQKSESVACHDGWGANMDVHVQTRTQQVMRVVPRENSAINQVWLSDRDRFSYAGLYHPQRLLAPRIKRDGIWEEVDWQTALNFAVKKLGHLLDEWGPDQLAVLASPSSTLEEFYLLQKFARALSCHNIDHRIRQMDFRDQHLADPFPKLSLSIEAIEQQDTIFFVGLHPNRDLPLLGVRIRKAVLQGAKAIALNCVDWDFSFECEHKLLVKPSELVMQLAAIVKALHEKTASSVKAPLETSALLAQVAITPEAQSVADSLLKASGSKTILMGPLAIHHPDASTIRSLLQLITRFTQANYGELHEGANAAGAWIAGAVPYREAAGKPSEKRGSSVSEFLKVHKKAYLLLGVEPELDCADAASALKSMHAADLVVSMTSFVTERMLEYADVLLPITPTFETAGTLVNVEGKWQSFSASTKPYADSKPAWKVLRVLGNLCQVNGFDYQTLEDVTAEVRAKVHKQNFPQADRWYCPETLNTALSELDQTEKMTLERMTPWAIYSVDGLSRRSQPLQNSAAQDRPGAYVSSGTAVRFGGISQGQKIVIKQGDFSVELSLYIDDKIPDGCLLTYGGHDSSALLGAAFGHVEVQVG